MCDVMQAEQKVWPGRSTQQTDLRFKVQQVIITGFPASRHICEVRASVTQLYLPGPTAREEQVRGTVWRYLCSSMAKQHACIHNPVLDAGAA
jgi:hypothetical protein